MEDVTGNKVIDKLWTSFLLVYWGNCFFTMKGSQISRIKFFFEYFPEYCLYLHLIYWWLEVALTYIHWGVYVYTQVLLGNRKSGCMVYVQGVSRYFTPYSSPLVFPFFWEVESEGKEEDIGEKSKMEEVTRGKRMINPGGHPGRRVGQ